MMTKGIYRPYKGVYITTPRGGYNTAPLLMSISLGMLKKIYCEIILGRVC